MTRILDDLNQYAHAFHQFGIDVTHMTPRMMDVDQLDLSTIDQMLQDELQKDAYHQQQFWLWIDGAAEAIGMLEADGYRLDVNGRVSRTSYFNSYKKRDRDAFVSKVRPNVERVKNHIRSAPLDFEAVPNNPDQAGTVAALNQYVDEIKNRNQFESQLDDFIDDGVKYGSGILFNARVSDQKMSNLQRYHEKVQQGMPLSYQEFVQYDEHLHQHKLEHIDTFEMIRCRYVKGKDSTHLKNHPWIHHVKQRRVADLRIEYPHVADRIQCSTDPVWQTTSPYSMLYEQSDDTATWYRHYVRFPVKYVQEVPVVVAGEVIFQKRMVYRDAIAQIDRIKDVGIVDMQIDMYHHGEFPLDYWVHSTSSKHACGIGLVKHGRDAQRIYTIMLNGKLRYFKRMVKGGGFFMGDVLDQKTINARTREHEWIKIDINKLPGELKNRPLNELIQDNRPGSFPQVYDNLLLNAERAIDEGMSVPNASKGVQQGSSGRQEAILANQAQMVMNSGLGALEKALLPMGRKLHQNILQFDAGTYFTIKRQDEVNGDTQIIEFNKQLDDYVVYDQFGEPQLKPLAILNNLGDLEISTQISTRSIIPSNPAEKRQFFQDILVQFFPYLQGGEKELVFLKHINKLGFGGIPHFDRMISELLAAEQKRQQQQIMAMQQEQQQQALKEGHRNEEKKAELNLDYMRLNQKFMTDLAKVLNQAKEGDTSGIPSILNQLQLSN